MSDIVTKGNGKVNGGISAKVSRVGDAGSAGRAKPDEPDQIVTAALESIGLELFRRTGTGEPFCTVTLKGEQLSLPIESTEFVLLIQDLYYRKTELPLSESATKEIVALLKARARFEGPEYPVFVRVARTESAIWLDLGEGRGYVEISAAGWMLRRESEVRFYRPLGFERLPIPAQGGSLRALRRLLNVTKRDFRLIVGWVLVALSGRGPYWILLITGEQGTAKSVLTRLVRGLADPSTVPLSQPPKDGQAAMIAASNSHVLAIDNMSSLPDWLADCLCRIATGAGMRERKFYTNREEVMFNVRNPVAANSIEFVARGDLLDRAISVQLSRIPKYRDETSLLEEYEAAKPSILGALLDLQVRALRNLDGTPVDPRFRMGDAARWATAALGPRLADDYAAMISEVKRQGVELDELAQEVVRLAPWEGTATDLLTLLDQKIQQLPRTARSLSSRLRRLAPALREVGVGVTFDRTTDRNRTKVIRIARLALTFDAGRKRTQMDARGEPASDAKPAPDGGLAELRTQRTQTVFSFKQLEERESKEEGEISENFASFASRSQNSASGAGPSADAKSDAKFGLPSAASDPPPAVQPSRPNGALRPNGRTRPPWWRTPTAEDVRVAQRAARRMMPDGSPEDQERVAVSLLAAQIRNEAVYDATGFLTPEQIQIQAKCLAKWSIVRAGAAVPVVSA